MKQSAKIESPWEIPSVQIVLKSGMQKTHFSQNPSTRLRRELSRTLRTSTSTNLVQALGSQ